ncbi:neutral zinc metallopeptidase [Modestobacter sp. VKM Ac-2986]|uniref:neutral zinc metallopeptidase n=1 Tax=Modestobacter sp. VKM Ac-2986 TaxID=3004140 RepID=UPI0022ABBD6C|nr:neutral zinc metallopeptidase [Modestobacter sp. VKM Ac-2986]MCZ2829552.1 neutral zinc metallopeptidase [Modestobacter sp. VKM Ac-2986]
MTSKPRRALLGAVLGALVASVALTGCAATLIEGVATPESGARADVAPADFPIIGAADDDVDVSARNALADLNTYWAEQFPDTFGEPFTPLTGGYFSVDPDDLDPARYPDGRIGCGQEIEAVTGNAFYCTSEPGEPDGDAIQYDRAFLGELADGYGRFIPALVMAHEFGHAVQGRVGYPIERSINVETQADCFAGAWTAWVAAGDAPHNSIRPGELDDVLRGYLLLRDPVGTGVGESQAHGSYFDRVSAFQQGFDDGPVACRDAFGEERVFTQGRFRDEDLLTGGDAPYAEAQELIEATLPVFWTAAFQARGETFQPPRVQPFSGTAPECSGGEPTTDLVWCAEDATVGYDETDLARPIYDAFGDYAVLTAVSIPYALAAREQLGLSADDEAAIRSAVCLTGAYTASVLQGGIPGIQISPGDVDESVQFLLESSSDPAVLDESGLTGFQLVDVFRSGVFDGLAACDIGA